MADLNNLIKLEADQDGVWLCSALPESELTPEKFNEINQNDIYELLKSHGVKKYELRAIELFIRSKTGQRVKVANRDAKLEQDAKISVSIAKDAMSASVVIEPPFFTKPWPSEANILAALKNKNIIFGIDKEAIKNLIANKIIEKHVIVAKGKEPIPGKDAYIELIKDPDNPFEIRDDERIDYWSRSTVLTVHPGTQVAIKHPLETGRDGLTVIGSAVKAPAVKNVEFAFGEGLARAADNPFSLVATADGQLKNQNKKLVVLPELEVNKDVDFGIGSIDFTGAVRIKG